MREFIMTLFRRSFLFLDLKFLNGRITKAVACHRIKRIEKLSPWKITTYYDENPNNYLAKLCDLYGSDKGEANRGSGHPYPWPSHTYTDYYSRLFDSKRLGFKRILECGIGTNNPDLPSSMQVNGQPGASLKVWRDYFPNALVYGVDIDREILFEEDRIKTFYLDQLDRESIVDFWKTIKDDRFEKFDLMIDDGLHTFEAGSNLFMNSIENLMDEGVYVIEDVSLADLLRYQRFFETQNFKVDYICLHRPSLLLGDNNLIVVRKIDIS
jgi:hypothetical protein